MFVCMHDAYMYVYVFVLLIHSLTSNNHFHFILGDGPALYLCDTCPKSFCVDCVTRHFGSKESKHIKELKIWSCYSCFPTEKMKKLVINKNTSLMNIDAIYTEIKPPAKNLNLCTNNAFLISPMSEDLQFKITDSERFLLQILTDAVNGSNSVFKEVGINNYLNAKDLRTLRCLSQNVRSALVGLMLYPGLFMTPFGNENRCRLFGKLFNKT